MNHFYNQDKKALLYLIHITNHNIYKIGVTNKPLEERLKYSKGIGELEWNRNDIRVIFIKFFDNAKDIELEIKKSLIGKSIKLKNLYNNSIITYHEHFYSESLNNIYKILNKYERSSILQ